MKINQYNFYFPSKLLKEVLPGEVFYFTAPCSGTPYTRIGASIDHTKFYILDIGCSEFFEPKEEDMVFLTAQCFPALKTSRG
jgi:hypothetical protein